MLVVIGTLAALVVAVMIIVSTIAAIFNMCQEQAEEVSKGGNAPSSEPSQDAVSDIPDDLLQLYQEKAEEYGIDWAVLAAVGKQETNHGQDYAECATSEDSARGLMQFIPSTWQSEGVDGNGDGEKDPCNDEDAVASGASYLKNLGAADDPHGALCSYYGRCGDANANYADEVMAQAEKYRGAAKEGGGSDGGSSGEGSGDSGGGSSGSQSPESGSSGGGTGVNGQTPNGWDLVNNEEKTMTYWSDTRFDSYLEAAVAEWNSLGGLNIQPADSREEANVVVFDGNSLDWAMGYTDTTNAAATKGTIEINEQKVSEVADETTRKALMVHELGHAIGFGHQNDKVSVMNQDLQTAVPTEMDVEIYRETWGGSGSPAGVQPSGSYGEEQTSEECGLGIWPWS